MIAAAISLSGVLLIGACASTERAGANDSDDGRLPMAAGERIFETRCDVCHALPAPASRDALAWRGVLATMAREAKLTANEKETLTEWLITHAKR